MVYSSFINIVLRPTSHSMFADCCVLKRWECHPMAAVGQQWPPWLMNVQILVLQESLPPAPFTHISPLPLPPPPLLPPHIIPPWCSSLDDTAQRSIQHGGCRADGSDTNGNGGCSSSPFADCLVHFPTYSYVIGHSPQQPHNVCRHIVTWKADDGRHGAPLPAPPHTTVTQYVGWLLYVAMPVVMHHGGHGTMAATMVGGCMV